MFARKLRIIRNSQLHGNLASVLLQRIGTGTKMEGYKEMYKLN